MKKIKGKIEAPKTTKIDATKYKYLKKIILAYYKHYEKIPDNNWLCKKASLSDSELDIYIKSLISENFLGKNAEDLYLKKQENEKEKSDKQIDDFFDKCRSFFKTENEKKEITSEVKPFFNRWINVLRYMLLFIGIGAVYMSVFYSYQWLLDFLIPPRAFLLSFILVCFAVASFELIIFFKQQNKKVLIIIFSFLWIIVTVFSMISTVAGQYNARIEKMNKRYAQEFDIDSSNIKFREYIEQKQDYQETLKLLQKDVSHFQKILMKYNTQEKIEQNKKFYYGMQWRYRRGLKEIESIKQKLKKLRQNRRDKVRKYAPDFYVWLSQIWGWRPEMIQFWMSMFPALFIDLVAPLSFAIVMFVEKKN